MGKQDARIDLYISKSAQFAQPVLNHLRQLVHQACPEVEETIKWGFPHFHFKGIMCSMSSFKNHCSFMFWKASLIPDTKNIFVGKEEGGMGQLGKLTSLNDLPADKVLISYIKKAAELNEKGIKTEKAKPSEKKDLVIPSELEKAFKKNKKAGEVFYKFSYSHQKEYIDWIAEAKTDATRDKRVSTAIEWLSEGKPRMWKYMKK